MVMIKEPQVKETPFSAYINRDSKLRADEVRRTFETGGLRVEEVAPPGDEYRNGDPKYRITATKGAGSLESMFFVYQRNVATGIWPNTMSCHLRREPGKEDKSGKLLELRLDLSDERHVSAPRMTIDLVEGYAGKPMAQVTGRVTPEYPTTPETPISERTMVPTVAVSTAPRHRVTPATPYAPPAPPTSSISASSSGGSYTGHTGGCFNRGWIG